MVSQGNFSFFRNFNNFRITDISDLGIIMRRLSLIHDNKCLVSQRNFRNFGKQPQSSPVYFYLEANNNDFMSSENFRRLVLSQGSNAILVAYSHEC